MIRLYTFCRSSAAFRVRIALNLKDIAYEPAFVHLRKNEQQAPEYLALNPEGLVPLLLIDGLKLTQSLAIAEYLDETRPTPPLLPKAPAARARVRALAEAIACDIHPIDNLRVLRYLSRSFKAGDAEIAAWFMHWVDLGLDAVEAQLAAAPETGRFCHGDSPSLADLCLVPQIFNALRYDKDPLSRRPRIKRAFESAMALDAFERARPENQPDFEA